MNFWFLTINACETQSHHPLYLCDFVCVIDMNQKYGKSILIVSSEAGIADLYAELLLSENYITNIANTGKECLSILRTELMDAILLDMELSDIDGWELIEKIEELEHDIPVIVITSKPPSAEIFPRLSIISDYLMKPVTMDGLIMAVRDALEIPALLENCIEVIKNHKNEEIVYGLRDKYFVLLKQRIIDSKIFFLMRQLYPEEKHNDSPSAKILLDTLGNKIEKAHHELESFKDKFNMNVFYDYT
jgi:CheY-like chemotaxis protein